MVYHFSAVATKGLYVKHLPVAVEALDVDAATGIATRLVERLYQGYQCYVTCNISFANDNFVVTEDNVDTAELARAEDNIQIC